MSNNSNPNQYLSKLSTNFVSPSLFRRCKSVDESQNSVPMTPETRIDVSSPTSQNSQKSSKGGFRWSIEQMAVMCPADIDETQHLSQTCPFEDAPDSEVQRTLNGYWNDVHNAFSPGMNPKSSSAVYPQTPKSRFQMRRLAASTPRSSARIPMNSSAMHSSTPSSQTLKFSTRSMSIERMSAICPVDIDDREHHIQRCPFDDTNENELDIQETLAIYWKNFHNVRSPGVPSRNSSPTTSSNDGQTHLPASVKNIEMSPIDNDSFHSDDQPIFAGRTSGDFPALPSPDISPIKADEQ